MSGKKRGRPAGSICSPEARARMSEAGKRAWARRAAGTSAAVPGWVPADLDEEFCDAAAQFGEEAAASVVRRMKREMAQEARR